MADTEKKAANDSAKPTDTAPDGALGVDELDQVSGGLIKENTIAEKLEIRSKTP